MQMTTLKRYVYWFLIISFLLIPALNLIPEVSVSSYADGQKIEGESTLEANARTDAIDDSLPLVKVGNEIITIGEFKDRVRHLSQTQQLRLMEDKESRKKFLDRLIDERLVYRKALQMGLDRDPEVAREVEIAREQIVVKKYVEDEIIKKVDVTRQEIEEFYSTNRERFIVSEQIRIRHILVTTEDEAVRVLERLKMGEDFAKLAEEKSIDPSGKRGGDLGWLEKRVMDQALAKAAFVLKKGEMSGVVTSRYGYHVLRVEDKKAPEYKDLDQVEDFVREMVAQQKENRIGEEIRDKLRKETKVSVEEERLDDIRINIGILDDKGGMVQDEYRK